jgi:hypothetical protein
MSAAAPAMAPRVFITAPVATSVLTMAGAETCMLVKVMLASDCPPLSVATEVTATNKVLLAQFT